MLTNILQFISETMTPEENVKILQAFIPADSFTIVSSDKTPKALT